MTEPADDSGVKHFGVRVDGVPLRATDMDWSFGSGAAIAGERQDLALALCGRRVGADRLTGPGTGRVTTR
ncbi:MAG: hypothetical protein QOD70_1745 [Frankiales bacterium]|jgi:hypothetical protein|nr:hypothetical protein [Frankiales bacterium]